MSEPGHEPLRLVIAEGVARITLNRPDRLNAFDLPLAEAWRRAVLESVSCADVAAILVEGRGRAFCAGGDLMAMAVSVGDGAEVARLARTINEGLLALLESAIPVVAAAHGTTAGGGLGILLASDYAIVSEHSRIGSRYANVGLTPDLSVTALLARAVGERRALQLVLQDRMLNAREAVEWGLAAESVAPEAVVARAEAVARSWVEAEGAYGQAKQLIRSAASRSIVEQLEAEAASIGQAFDTPRASERIAAFTAGRRA